MYTAVLCLALTAAPAAEPPTLLLAEMTGPGMEIPGLGRHKLEPPLMADGLPKDKAKAVVKKFTDEYPEFLERSLHAWYPRDKLVIPLEDKKGEVQGREIVLRFAAYGDIKHLDEHNMLNALMGLQTGRKTGKEKDTEYLDEDELKERKITPQKLKDGEERYAILNSLLLDKIQLTGVMRTQKRWVNGSLVSAMRLDERFANDKKYPNRWQDVGTDSEGVKREGPKKPYHGFGGYVKATPIPETKDGIFIEMRFAYSEPYDWFDGKNVLASKLPTKIEENVKNLRRQLKARSGK